MISPLAIFVLMYVGVSMRYSVGRGILSMVGF